MRLLSADMYSTFSFSRLIACGPSFWNTTRTGRTPYLYGFVLPKGARASSSDTKTCVPIVTFEMVWRALYSAAGRASNFSLSLSAANAAAILRNRKRRLKAKGIYLLYRALELIGLPFLLFYFLARGVRDFRYIRSLAQRFGFLPHSFRETVPGAIWLHAVSVGEVLSLGEFVRQVR